MKNPTAEKLAEFAKNPENIKQYDYIFGLEEFDSVNTRAKVLADEYNAQVSDPVTKSECLAFITDLSETAHIILGTPVSDPNTVYINGSSNLLNECLLYNDDSYSLRDSILTFVTQSLKSSMSVANIKETMTTIVSDWFWELFKYCKDVSLNDVANVGFSDLTQVKPDIETSSYAKNLCNILSHIISTFIDRNKDNLDFKLNLNYHDALKIVEGQAIQTKIKPVPVWVVPYQKENLDTEGGVGTAFAYQITDGSTIEPDAQKLQNWLETVDIAKSHLEYTPIDYLADAFIEYGVDHPHFVVCLLRLDFTDYLKLITNAIDAKTPDTICGSIDFANKNTDVVIGDFDPIYGGGGYGFALLTKGELDLTAEMLTPVKSLNYNPPTIYINERDYNAYGYCLTDVYGSDMTPDQTVTVNYPN